MLLKKLDVERGNRLVALMRSARGVIRYVEAAIATPAELHLFPFCSMVIRG